MTDDRPRSSYIVTAGMISFSQKLMSGGRLTAGMIAGGSGLTPMMQVASRVLADKDDKTQASATIAIIGCFCTVSYAGGSAADGNAVTGLATCIGVPRVCKPKRGRHHPEG